MNTQLSDFKLQSIMDNDIEMESVVEENDQQSAPKSLIELYAQRSDKLREIKTKIANYSTAVISHPEINMKKLRDLLSMYDIRSDDPDFGLIFFSIQKMVALAALEVFRDILPNYRVKEKINEEDDEKNAKRKNFQLKKETKRLREYEKTLIILYRLYLNRLQRMADAVSHSKSKKSDFYNQMLTSVKSKERIAAIGLKCMSQLVLSHPNFNFRQQIIETIVQMMANNKYQILSDICCETITKIFRTDKLGEISLEAVKAVAKLVKQRNYRLDPKVLRTFLALRIKEVKQREEINKKDMKKLRVKLNLMSRKERKRNKRMQKLDNQLLEVDAQESRQRKLDFNTEILNQIFITYFRILKNQRELTFNDTDDDKWFTALLTPVLEGLSRFAHLINYEFFYDLVSLLYQLIRDKRLNTHQTLHCLHTVFTILSGEGKALNIDFQRFYSELYVQLMSIDANTEEEDIKILLSCLDVMIIKRKKQMTQNRVLAFIKRLSSVSTQTTAQASASLMAVIRQIMINHKQSDILLDSEATGIGSGIFLPELDDPEHCNANSALLWELTALSSHFDPLVQQYAKHLLNFSSSNTVPIADIRREPKELLNSLVSNFSDFQLFGQRHDFSIKKKHKINYNSINSKTSLTSKCFNYIKKLDSNHF